MTFWYFIQCFGGLAAKWNLPVGNQPQRIPPFSALERIHRIDNLHPHQSFVGISEMQALRLRDLSPIKQPGTPPFTAKRRCRPKRETTGLSEILKNPCGPE